MENFEQALKEFNEATRKAIKLLCPNKDAHVSDVPDHDRVLCPVCFRAYVSWDRQAKP